MGKRWEPSCDAPSIRVQGERGDYAAMTQALARCGLSEQRYHLLLELAAAGPDGQVQGELANDLRCPETRISLLVRELCQAPEQVRPVGILAAEGIHQPADCLGHHVQVTDTGEEVGEGNLKTG